MGDSRERLAQMGPPILKIFRIALRSAVTIDAHTPADPMTWRRSTSQYAFISSRRRRSACSGRGIWAHGTVGIVGHAGVVGMPCLVIIIIPSYR